MVVTRTLRMAEHVGTLGRLTLVVVKPLRLLHGVGAQSLRCLELSYFLADARTLRTQVTLPALGSEALAL